MKKKVISVLVAILIIACSALAALAQQDKKKPTASFINSLKSPRIIELNFIWDSKSPILTLNPPFVMPSAPPV